ncbi:MAG: hypothetical protein D3923_00665, partial [Candidatus Electrothrix sp. AR3]|nr:hypothetical protein [Candidatus Electrothrix sp. AR3]
GNFSEVITVTTTNDGSEDVTAEIQTALDEAALLPAGAIVYLPAGLYRLDGELTINSSNIVLRGAGAEQTKLFFTDAVTGILVGNDLNFIDNVSWQLTSDGAIFDTFVEVQDPTGISVGDDIVIAWNITDAFRLEHNSSQWWNHVPFDGQRIFFRRVVTSLDGNRIYFKVPLRYPIKLRDMPVVRKVTNYISGNAVEHLGINTALSTVEDSWNGVDQTTAITVTGCKDWWIQHVNSFAKDGEVYHLRSHGIYVQNSLRGTITHCNLERTQNLGNGGNGYLFPLSRSNEILVKDSIGRYGRYNFIVNWDFGTIGNVFLRVESTGGRICDQLQDQLNDTCFESGSDFHHSLAIANLFDTALINDELNLGNRKEWSVGAGQTGTENVFWNTSGSGNINSYNYGMGYVIGTAPEITVSTDPYLTGWPFDRYATGTAPEDFSEHLGFGSQLEPSSLYEDQLTKRLNQQ